MNPSLQALMSQLTLQGNELNTSIQASQARCLQLEKEIDDFDNQSHHTNTTASLLINPEVEMSRLRFVLSLEEKKHHSQLALHEEQILLKRLEDKALRITIEIKALENYLDKQHQSQIKKNKKQQEQALDEWALTQRKSA